MGLVCGCAAKNMSWFSKYFVRIEGRSGKYPKDKSVIFQNSYTGDLESAIKNAEEDFKNMEARLDFDFEKINYEVHRILGDSFKIIPEEEYKKYIALKTK